MADNLRFLSNNVNRLRWNTFPQETHSSKITFNEWQDDFKGERFFHIVQQVLAV